MKYIKEYKSSKSYEEGDYVLAFRGKMYYCQIIEKESNNIYGAGSKGVPEIHTEYLLVGYEVISGKSIGIQVREINNAQNTIIRKLKPNEIGEYDMYDKIEKYNL